MLLPPALEAGKGAPTTRSTPCLSPPQIAVIGIDIGKNAFHVVGHDERGAVVLRQKWSRGLVETRSHPDPFREPGLDRGATR